MRRFFAIGGVVLLLALVAWMIRGSGSGDASSARRAGSSREKSATTLRWSGREKPDGDTLAAKTEGAVEGRVIDAIDGRAIAGATVTLRSAEGEDLDETSTQEDGSFSFEETGAAVLVSAAAPGYAIRAKELDSKEIVLELDGAVTVSGVVVDPGGHPVADAEVWIEDRERRWFRPPTVSGTVRSNAEGRFAIEDSPSGTLVARAEHPDFASATLELGGLGPGRDKGGVRLELRDTGALSGRVLDESGAPVAAKVSWLPPDEEDVTTTAGADGRFRFAHLPPGTGVVRATTEGGDGGANATIAFGSEASVDVVVHAESVFSGTVVDAADRPVAGAEVLMGFLPGPNNDTPLARLQRDRGERWETVTDAAGQFWLHAPVEEEVELQARTPTASGRLLVEPDSTSIVIRLTALGVLHVRVTDKEGKPYLSGGRAFVESGSPAGAEGRWGKGQNLQKGTATFDGRPGEWRVRAVAEGAADEEEAAGERPDADDDDDAPPRLRPSEVRVQVGPAPPETEVTIRLPLATPTFSTVRGRIVGSDGAPVVAARVSVLVDTSDWGGGTGARLDWGGAVRSDASGRFSLEASPGTQKLFVYHPEFRSETVVVVVPPQGVGDVGTIRLESGTGSSAVYEFSGIGAVLALGDQQQCVIKDVIANGPAQRAGIRANDVLLEIDGVPLHGMSLGDVVERIRGPIGTTVMLRLERPGNLEPFVIDVVRDKIRT